MAKRVVTAMLLVLGAALTANCGEDSDGTSGGGGGMGGEGPITGAGEGTGATSSGGTNTGATGGMGDAGSSTAVGGVGELGGGPSLGGAAQAGAGGGGSGFVCPTTITDYPVLITQAICGKRVECCESDAQTCATEVTTAMAEIFPGLAQAKADGIVAEDCAALEACVAAIDAANCADWPKERPELYGLPVDEPACRGIIKGLVAPEDECLASYQCDNGVCNSDACVALIADGQPCDAGTCRLATSYCNAQDECAPREPNGTACTADGDCASRICDIGNTGLCIAPDPVTECEFVPEAGCSMSGRPARGNVGWSLLVAALVLGAGTRRRVRHEARRS